MNRKLMTAKSGESLAGLDSSLFWDVDGKSLNLEAHARFIIERVITRGNIDDWLMLLNVFGKKRIRDEVVRIRSLDLKTVNYLSIYFGIDKSEFRCCN